MCFPSMVVIRPSILVISQTVLHVVTDSCIMMSAQRECQMDFRDIMIHCVHIACININISVREISSQSHFLVYCKVTYL